MLRARRFAVSLVYYKIDPSKVEISTDDDGKPTGFKLAEGHVLIGCTTGISISPTPSTAIIEVRRKQEADFQGWIEQIAQTHEFALKGWWEFNRDYMVYFGKWLGWRLRRALR